MAAAPASLSLVNHAQAASAFVPSSEDGGPVVLHNVPWETYEGLLSLLGDDHPTLRLTYREGVLEIMTTSRYPETLKTIIARLLEMWAVEAAVSISGYGAATFRKRAKERGLEPDECYVVDPPPLPPNPKEEDLPEIPDIAIEVVYRHVVDKLDVYAGLGVKEVWIWEQSRFVVHRLSGDRYDVCDASALLPTLDLAELASFVRPEAPQTELVRSYRDALRQSAAGADRGRREGT
jgi:Uma2 family endonuclease